MPLIHLLSVASITLFAHHPLTLCPTPKNRAKEYAIRQNDNNCNDKDFQDICTGYLHRNVVISFELNLFHLMVPFHEEFSLVHHLCTVQLSVFFQKCTLLDTLL